LSPPPSFEVSALSDRQKKVRNKNYGPTREQIKQISRLVIHRKDKRPETAGKIALKMDKF